MQKNFLTQLSKEPPLQLVTRVQQFVTPVDTAHQAATSRLNALLELSEPIITDAV